MVKELFAGGTPSDEDKRAFQMTLRKSLRKLKRLRPLNAEWQRKHEQSSEQK